MNILFDDQRQMIKVLLAKGVKFLLVGGYAVVFYGHNRVTGDLDIWLQPDNDNKLNFIDALRDLHFEEEGLQLILEKDFSKPQLFYFGIPPERTDFMTFISGVKFDEAYLSAAKGKIDSIDIKVIQLKHLIQNKKASGRLKDLADVEQLELILKEDQQR